MILIFLLYAILASSFTIGKMLLSFVPALFLTGLRMSVAGALLLVLFKLFDTNQKMFHKKDLFMLLGFSAVHILIPYTTEFTAMESVASCCAALMFNLSPFFSPFFSFFYFF